MQLLEGTSHFKLASRATAIGELSSHAGPNQFSGAKSLTLGCRAVGGGAAGVVAATAYTGPIAT